MRNMSTIDRIVRAAFVAGIAAVYFIGWLSGPWALGLGAIAAILLATSLFGTCPAYMPFGLSTRRRS